MRPFSLIMAALAAATLHAPTHAQEALDLSIGNGLHASCTADDAFTKIQCLRYIQGFDDGMVAMAFEQGRVSKIPGPKFYLYCAPSPVTLGQKMAVVEKYLEAAPQVRHLPSNALVLVALQRAFPCNRASS